jgi:hypothetical protein
MRKFGGVQRPGGAGTALIFTVAGIGQGGDTFFFKRDGRPVLSTSQPLLRCPLAGALALSRTPRPADCPGTPFFNSGLTLI